MDRASDSGSEGWGFESLPVYQIKEEIPFGISSFILCFAREGTRKGGTSAHTGVKTCRWHVFSPWESPWIGERNSQNCETISIKRCAGRYQKVSPLLFRASHGRGLEDHKCNSPMDCCLPPAGWRQHLNFCPSHARAKMQTSPFRCTKSSVHNGFERFGHSIFFSACNTG